MRIWIVVVALLVPVAARAQSAPSNTMERAIKLYDKEDYLSATIELKKVLSGETADGADQLARAQFFLGKSIYQLGLYAASLEAFEQIAADDANPYHDATLKWLLALARVLPVGSGLLEQIAAYPLDSDAVLQLGELADEHAALLGNALLARGDFDAAGELLRQVPEGSPQWPAAQRALGEVLLRSADVAHGLDAMTAAARDPDLGALAVRQLVFWTRMLGQASSASTALDELAAGNGPAAPYATLASSRLAHEIPALRGLTDSFDALAIVLVCREGAVDDFVGEADTLARAVTKKMQELRRADDNVELFDATVAFLATDDPTASALRLSLGRADPLNWTAELEREGKVYAQTDAAWRTTAVAADILSELELRRALAHADAGQWLRDRFEALHTELMTLDAVDSKLRAGTDGDGLVVPPALCAEAGLSAAPTPQVAVAPPVVAPPQHHGCAGCAATDPAPGLILLVAFALRRRRRAGDN